ncbi:maleate cis-trans isomerase family protein [Variovorax saccharolyticus]|uniref:maleate cis-trans isomerase family protein n=1 Tax=Variovorax saccharolyticus TaxID=3053516 RepID=UPI0025756D8E|nr:aspartate/glutamate racemase family protein [Variovorax sp. J31P216]MDM0029211.1 aspartate/glutamate racemase family protein [Variovorax sp. J31P216]
MSRPRRIGVLTPSSNTALEPLTSAMVAGVPGVSAHFSRFRVTEISMGDRSRNQFDERAILDAAGLLADARVDVICWSGTSASWLGFERDRALCARIAEATGIPATTSVLALNELLAAQGAGTLGLVSPYVEDVQRRIVANYAALGVACVAERHLDLSVNFSFAEVDANTLRAMLREVAQHKPDAITVMCTNLHGAPLADEMERELGIPIYDSVATVVWKALKITGIDTRQVAGWGGLFALP